MSVKKNLAVMFKASQSDDGEVDAYVEELQKIGLTPHIIQVLGFDFINADQLLQKLSLDGNDVSGIVFTSQRAVEAVYKCVATSDELLKLIKIVYARLHVFAVGEATARKVDKLLGLSVTGHNSGNAESLAEFIKNVVPPASKPLLFPCGNLHGDRLRSILEEAGINVDSVLVYETKPNNQLEFNIKEISKINGFPEFLLYFSPSGVSFTLPILRKLDFPLTLIKFVAIGPSTKEALHCVNLEPICTAKQPNAKCLAAAIFDYRDQSC